MIRGILPLVLCLNVGPALASTFVESINENFEAISFEELEKRVERHAKRGQSYLSLGESHLEPSTTREIHFRLMQAFLEHSSRAPIVCSESIRSFLTEYAPKIQKSVREIKILKGNGPSTTNFRDCEEGKSPVLAYSGYFHQFPFARNFSHEFPKI